MQNLLIFGAGQYGMVAKETAEAMSCFDKIDFLDDNNPIAVGKLSDFAGLYPKYTHAIVAIGNPDVRLELLQDIQAAPLQLATLIHPRSYVSPTAKVSDGCIVEAMAVVNADAEIGLGCIISAGAVMNHNSILGNVCHIDCNAVIKSNAVVKTGTKINCGKIVE